MDGLITVQDITKVLGKKGYKIFEGDKKPFNLNIVGIRSNDMTPDDFNDLITIFWRYNSHWSLLKFKATTDPGLYYLNNPIKGTKGTGILKPNQYPGMWEIGKHKGEEAFVQVKECSVYRDDNRDSSFDMDESTVETGYFGCNGHNSNNLMESIKVGKYSAMCQVWANPHEHAVAMKIANVALEYWNNSFTYTLIEEKDF